MNAEEFAEDWAEYIRKQERGTTTVTELNREAHRAFLAMATLAELVFLEQYIRGFVLPDEPRTQWGQGERLREVDVQDMLTLRRGQVLEHAAERIGHGR